MRRNDRRFKGGREKRRLFDWEPVKMDGIQPFLRVVFLAGLGMLVASLAAVSGASGAAAEETCWTNPNQILVTIDNVRSAEGLVTAVLYDDKPEHFLKKGKRLDRARVEAQAGATKLCLAPPGPGDYAIAIYHDENGNKKFDRNFIGIPTEGYGFSNNPGFRFGKPDLEEVLFQTNGAATEMTVSFLYLSDDIMSGQSRERETQ